MSKRILIILTNHDQIDPEHRTGLWFEEFALPYQHFREQRFEITLASPQGGQAPLDPRSIPNAKEAQNYSEALRLLKVTHPLSSINPTDYDAVFLPGGHGTMYDLPTPKVGQVISQFAQMEKIIAAVCHGPAELIAAQQPDGRPLVEGKQVTGFTNSEEQAVQLDQLMPFLLESKLRDLGAKFIGKSNFSDHVVVDGNLITGQNPQSSASAAQAVIEALLESHSVQEAS